MGFKNFKFINNRGQTVVEYILLLAVVVFVSMAIFRSSYMQDFFGEDGAFATAYRTELEYSYRFAIGGRGGINVQFSSPNHPSYKNAGQTRFFGPKNGYPE